jgi:putative YhbY family RNA-binding protein
MHFRDTRVVYISPMESTLTPARRRELRAAAHHLHPVVAIGQHGLTPAVLHEIDVALAAHELVKIRVFNDDRAERENMLARVCAELDALPVQHLGKMLILWRAKPVAAKPSARATPKAEPPTTKRSKAKDKPAAGKPSGKPGAKKAPGGRAATPRARTIPKPAGGRTGAQWSAAGAAAKRGGSGAGAGRTTAGPGAKRTTAGPGAKRTTAGPATKRTTAGAGAKRTSAGPAGTRGATATVARRTAAGPGTRRTGTAAASAPPAAARRRRART